MLTLKSIPKIKFTFFLVIVGFIIFFFSYSSQPELSKAVYTIKPKIHIPSNWASITECRLPKVDPWDSQDASFFQPPKKTNKCTPTKTEISKLENGLLTILQINSYSKCEYRCLNYEDDLSKTLGPWMIYQFPVDVHCDWVEVLCISKNLFITQKFRQIHSQIYSRKNVTSEKQGYNVYILGLDAISHGEFHRTMPKTAYFIENEMEGINFKHLSKVGYNSAPNQLSALFGQRFTSMPHSPPGYPRFNISNPYFCEKHHTKNEQYIGFIYNENGYRTLHIEDIFPLIPAYPNCKGFGFVYTNHSSVPLSIRLKDSKFENGVLSGSCKKKCYLHVELFENYIKASTSEKKFGYVMLTEPGHEGINDPYKFDDYFYEWLQNMKTNLDDAFLFVWSDHGHHFGRFSSTAHGQTDTRNPMLTVILPKALRENPAHPLVQNLRKNAQTLVSQYDIFPTLVDLATANFNDPASFSTHLTLKDLQKLNKRIHEVHGDSLLRPLTHRTPTCAGLGIPFTFCLCRWPLFTPPDTSQLREIVINKLPTLLNGYIETIGATKKCMKLAVDPKRNINVEEVAVKLPKKTSRMIRTQFSIAGYDSNNDYLMEVFFQIDKNGKLSLTGRIFRFDSQWSAGRCLVNEYDQYFCICKQVN